MSRSNDLARHLDGECPWVPGGIQPHAIHHLVHGFVGDVVGPRRMSNLSMVTTGDGCGIAYRFDGPEHAPILAMSNSIGTSLRMWDGQVQELSKHFRVLRYDTRGHGASGVPDGPYSLDRMGRDVIELLDTLRLDRVHFCGLSFGGLIGQWLGVHAPDRVDRLILSNTSPYLGPPARWDGLIAAVLQAPDMSETAQMFLKNWFPSHMLEADGSVVASFRETLLAMDPRGLAGCYAAIRDSDMRRTIALIPCPTLVIGGQHDTVCLPSHSELIAKTIPQAKLEMLPAVHLSNVDLPDAFVRAVGGFLLSNWSGARVPD